MNNNKNDKKKIEYRTRTRNLNIMILIKWAKNWEDTSKAPSIISLLLNIFLKGGSVDNMPLFGSSDGKTQERLHIFILIIAIICIKGEYLKK